MQYGLYVKDKLPLASRSYIEKLNNPITNIKLPYPHQRLTTKPETVVDPYLNEIVKQSDRVLVVLDQEQPPGFYLHLLKLTHNTNKTCLIFLKDRLLPKTILQDTMAKYPREMLKVLYEKYVNPSGAISNKPTVPQSKNVYQTPNGATLRPYQALLVDFIMEKRRCALFVDMGLGKTLTTLEAINQMIQQNKINTRKPILIVAPILVALDTWSREAEKWGYDMDVKINIQLTKKKREKLFEEVFTQPLQKPTILTTNPEQLAHIIDYTTSKGVNNPFDCIVIDELSLFKSPTAKRYENLSYLTKYVPYVIGLTGTPAPNGLMDIWTQLNICSPETRQTLGYTFWEYRETFFKPEWIGPDGTVYEWGLKPRAKEEIYRRIKPYTYALRSDGIVKIPDIVYSDKIVTLPKKAKELYDELDVQIREELRNGDEVEHDSGMTVANAAVLNGKLTQLSSGAIYNPDGTYEVFHNEKIKAFIEIVETNQSPVLGFYQYQHEHDELVKALKKARIKYSEIDDKKNASQVIKDWNAGKIPVLLLHPASAGHGLNIQEGGHTMVWLTTTWSNEQYRQAVARLHRPGQTHTTSVIHIVAKDTVDETINPRIDTKEANQQELLNALKR